MHFEVANQVFCYFRNSEVSPLGFRNLPCLVFNPPGGVKHPCSRERNVQSQCICHALMFYFSIRNAVLCFLNCVLLVLHFFLYVFLSFLPSFLPCFLPSFLPSFLLSFLPSLAFANPSICLFSFSSIPLFSYVFSVLSFNVLFPFVVDVCLFFLAIWFSLVAFLICISFLLRFRLFFPILSFCVADLFICFPFCYIYIYRFFQISLPIFFVYPSFPFAIVNFVCSFVLFNFVQVPAAKNTMHTIAPRTSRKGVASASF